MDKTIIADLSADEFAMLISFVTRTKKIQNLLLFHKFRQKLANRDVTKEALNCTASLLQLSALLMVLVSSGIFFRDPKISSEIRSGTSIL